MLPYVTSALQLVSRMLTQFAPSASSPFSSSSSSPPEFLPPLEQQVHIQEEAIEALSAVVRLAAPYMTTVCD
jgi:hypothetical protein